MSLVSVSPHTLVLSSDSSIVTDDTFITNGSSVPEARAITDSVTGRLQPCTCTSLGLSVSPLSHAVAGFRDRSAKQLIIFITGNVR